MAKWYFYGAMVFFFSILCVIPPSQNIPLSPKNALKSSLLVTRQNEAPSNMAPNIALDLSNGSPPKTNEKCTKKNRMMRLSWLVLSWYCMLVNFVDIFSIPMNFKTCNPVKFDSNVETCVPLDSKKKHQLSKDTTLFRPKKGQGFRSTIKLLPIVLHVLPNK